MTRPFWLGLLLAAGCAGGAATRRDWPDVDRLPSRPSMPDVLETFDGRRVSSPEAWRDERRPELRTLFQHYMYGYFPPAPAAVDAKVRRVDPQALGGKATLKEITITWAPAPMPSIELLLVIPNRREGPSPCVFGLNFSGNHTVLPDPKIRLPGVWLRERKGVTQNNRATEEGRGSSAAGWSIEASIDRGYAIATFCNADIAPDKHDWSEGIQRHYYRQGQTEPGPHDWGTIAAWAWGLQRAVDVLVRQPELDPRRLAVFGHSRNGKTALLAAAYDDRIALAIPHQAGCGGTAPSRGTVGESVARINQGFPHWFNDTFVRFGDKVDRLPFDQHGLVAVCAPRPVFFTNAIDDQWANPSGQFQVLKAATPAYRLLGVDGLEGEKEPSPGDPPILSRLGYWIRAGKHSTTPEDWKVFLDFCDRWLAGR